MSSGMRELPVSICHHCKVRPNPSPPASVAGQANANCVRVRSIVTNAQPLHGLPSRMIQPARGMLPLVAAAVTPIPRQQHRQPVAGLRSPLSGCLSLQRARCERIRLAVQSVSIQPLDPPGVSALCSMKVCELIPRRYRSPQRPRRWRGSRGSDRLFVPVLADRARRDSGQDPWASPTRHLRSCLAPSLGTVPPVRGGRLRQVGPAPVLAAPLTTPPVLPQSQICRDCQEGPAHPQGRAAKPRRYAARAWRTAHKNSAARLARDRTSRPRDSVRPGTALCSQTGQLFSATTTQAPFSAAKTGRTGPLR